MTDAPHSDDLTRLDTTARQAAAGLRRHVDQHLDADQALAAAPAVHSPTPRHRVMALAAVVALLVGSLALLDTTGDDDRNRLELDEDGNRLPDPQPGVLTPLGPRDGKDSIQLPVTVEPNRDLADATVVAVTGEGFVPGERVGIVQCAREAGGDSPEVRGGVDACNVGGVQYADADADGVAAGTIAVQRVLTTPMTGTVDCAAEADRCIVAMGALNDYDRSGGFGVEVRGGGEPIRIPEVTVTPTEGLADGDVVRVEGRGLTPGDEVGFSVCSSDPVACWQASPTGGGYGTTVDGAGSFTIDVPVWRYLPGDGIQPDSYVDCALSRCSLRVMGQSTPPPVPLSFLPGGEGPRAPAISVDPTDGVGVGDRILVRGAGLAPDLTVAINLCVAPVGQPEMVYGCMGFDTGGLRVDGDGGFAVEVEVPRLDDWGGGMMETEACDGSGTCTTQVGGAVDAARCDGTTTVCTITVEVWSDTEPTGPPTFRPVPVPITFR